jgi:beta-lactamase class A
MTIIQCAYGEDLQHKRLDQGLNQLTSGFPGRVGVCVLDKTGASCVHGGQSFSLQSVMKLTVSLAVLDAIDHQQLSLDDQVIVHRQDLSLYVQPIADLVGPNGYRTTVRDLIHRAIVDSDSAASDILARKIGGTRQVQSFLDRAGIQGIRIDRDERHLQTEIVGLTWRPEYVDPQVLRKAIESVPARDKEAAYRRYQVDIRDTSTPFGMASLLQRLSNGDLLSPTSTQFALETMAETVTFPDRLKAGVPTSWVCMHKTGTSGSWHGVTAATNDVGILRTPGGTYIAIAVFVADTKEPSATRARLIKTIAAETVKNFR